MVRVKSRRREGGRVLTAVGEVSAKAVLRCRLWHWANLVGIHRSSLGCVLLRVVGCGGTGCISGGSRVGLVGGGGAFGRQVDSELSVGLGVGGVVIVVNCDRGEVRRSVIVGIVVVSVVVIVLVVGISCGRGEMRLSLGRFQGMGRSVGGGCGGDTGSCGCEGRHGVVGVFVIIIVGSVGVVRSVIISIWGSV